MNNNQPVKTQKRNNGIIIAGCVALAVMLVSYIFALGKFSDNVNESSLDESSLDMSEVSSESVSEDISYETSTDKVSYYDSLELENCSFRNEDVVNGTLALINESVAAYPLIDQSELVRISSVKTGSYGLSTTSLHIYKEAMDSFDAFINSFYAQVPDNGLIINKAYTDPQTSSGVKFVNELSTGHSLQFFVYNSPYSFADTEFSYLYEQAFRYGIIQRYPEGKETFFESDPSVYRYVGLAHSTYMNHYNYCLEEYHDALKTNKIIEFESQLEADTVYIIYYVPIDETAETTYVPVPSDGTASYTISGDGSSGFIVTVKVKKQ